MASPNTVGSIRSTSFNQASHTAQKSVFRHDDATKRTSQAAAASPLKTKSTAEQRSEAHNTFAKSPAMETFWAQKNSTTFGLNTASHPTSNGNPSVTQKKEAPAGNANQRTGSAKGQEPSHSTKGRASLSSDPYSHLSGEEKNNAIIAGERKNQREKECRESPRCGLKETKVKERKQGAGPRNEQGCDQKLHATGEQISKDGTAAQNFWSNRASRLTTANIDNPGSPQAISTVSDKVNSKAPFSSAPKADASREEKENRTERQVPEKRQGERNTNEKRPRNERRNTPVSQPKEEWIGQDEIKNLKFSQCSISATSMHPSGRGEWTIGELEDAMRKKFNKEGALHIVKMPPLNGSTTETYTSIDNRRLHCAKQIAEKNPDYKIYVVKHEYNDRLAGDERGRLTKIWKSFREAQKADTYRSRPKRLSSEIRDPLEADGIQTSTWGEMVRVRIASDYNSQAFRYNPNGYETVRILGEENAKKAKK